MSEEYSEDEHTDRLSATMAMVSDTYPTIVYYKKAVACGLPKHFMDLRFPPDKWGRVPCKREAMEWYLQNTTIDQETKKKIDSKIEKQLESAERSLNLDFSKAEVEVVDGKLVKVGKENANKSIPAEGECHSRIEMSKDT